MTDRFVQAPELTARINVTPIIDVALVLVIILLITAPMLSVTDKSLDLPSSRWPEGASQQSVWQNTKRSASSSDLRFSQSHRSSLTSSPR